MSAYCWLCSEECKPKDRQPNNGYWTIHRGCAALIRAQYEMGSHKRPRRKRKW